MILCHYMKQSDIDLIKNFETMKVQHCVYHSDIVYQAKLGAITSIKSIWEIKKDPWPKIPISRAIVSLSLNIIIAIWVEQSFLNPNRNVYKILNLMRKCRSLSYITSSKAFDGAQKMGRGPLFTRKTPSYQYRDSHYKPETVVRPS